MYHADSQRIDYSKVIGEKYASYLIEDVNKPNQAQHSTMQWIQQANSQKWFLFIIRRLNTSKIDELSAYAHAHILTNAHTYTHTHQHLHAYTEA